MIANFLRKLGALRVMLFLAALLSAISMSWVDLSLEPVGMGILRAVVLPALPPIVFMVLMLDLMMCQILKADSATSSVRRHNLSMISRVHLLMAIILLMSWLPIFLRATYF
jgi:hypothetical protein